MRRLYFVPVIHMGPDMGSLALALDEKGRTELGQEAWQKHKEAVSGFWDSIGQFFDGLDVKGFKVYQDGMVADGAEGLRIIREGINQESKNYEIVGKLLERGAALVKTEDLTLVREEYDYVTKIARARSPREKEAWSLRYKLAQDSLLRRRDNFIAHRINDTLGEGETGILFIGASHEILPLLSKDIEVITVKAIF